jgi:hypothetical protein
VIGFGAEGLFTRVNTEGVRWVGVFSMPEFRTDWQRKKDPA